MADKRTRGAFLSVTLAAFALFLSGCADEDPVAKLKETIAAMETAIEAHKPGEFVEHVTEDFVGEGGSIDHRALRSVIMGQLLGNETVEVTLGPIDVKLHGNDKATVKVSAFVIGGRFLPERGDSIDITSGWRLEDGEWKCYTAEWDR